jgi:spore germination cell wall hydrolase CwlJ-like protein
MHAGLVGVTRDSAYDASERLSQNRDPDLPAATRPRAGDFVARLESRRAAQRRRRRHWRRGLIALAAIAVPALAAPQEWSPFEIGNAGEADVSVEPMPFERAGDSFPGSAFYYLAADDDRLTWAPGLGEGIHSDAEPAPTAFSPQAGPAARALRIDNSGVDRTRAEQCLTAAIYYEAASEPDGGQRAVAQVVLNRVAHASYPNTVCGVVYQGSERRTGCQFSFTCDGSLARRPSPLFWERARRVAQSALAGYVYTPVGLATHYHTFAVHPYWSDSLVNVANIGAHRFFRFPGRAGQPGAFRFAYAGGEPIAAPHARSAAADAKPDPALDPLAIERAYEQGFKTAQATLVPTASGLAPARPAAPPIYSA